MGKCTVNRLAWPGSLTTSMRFIITSASRSPSPLHSVRSRFARSIKLLDINRRVGDRPTLADLCRAGVLAHAFIFLNFEQDDFGRGLISHCDYFALLIFLLDRLVYFDFVSFGKSIVGAQRNPNFLSFNELDNSLHISESGSACCGCALAVDRACS